MGKVLPFPPSRRVTGQPTGPARLTFSELMQTAGARAAAARARLRRHGGQPYSITTERGSHAVAVVVGDRELWFSPDEARQFARDLARMALHAEDGGGSSGADR